MGESTELQFPATCIGHWATGPVACCDKHIEQLKGLGKRLGYSVAVTALPEPAECINCVNEQKQMKGPDFD